MTNLQTIGEETKDVWGMYWKVVQPYRNQLWKYCLRLTGTPWDAEDLLQDTLLKSFASLSALSHRQQNLKTKSYLFRVATNHWLDQCRRNRRLSNEDIDENHLSEEFNDSLEVNEAILSLIHNLTPRQTVVFILIESFRFTANEVAELLSSSEGAINGLLNRARKKLYDIRESNGGIIKEESNINIHSDAVKEFIEAYNRKDFNGIANMLIDHSTFSFVEMNSKEYGKETILKYSLNPNKGTKLQTIFATSTYLFGKQTIIFTKQTAQGTMLFDVNTVEWENGKVARWNCYYFCREFMQYIADHLELPLAPIEM
ncbi:RNA polymerase sigma factor [Cytobacillus sp. Hm23]